MKSKLGVLFIVAGVCCIIAAGYLFISNYMDDKRAGESAAHIVEVLRTHVDQEKKAVSEPIEITGEEEIVIPDPYDPTMPEFEIDGENYIGFVTIPTLERRLPVMTDWSYDKLMLSPCRYFGSAKSDDLVIMAHNFSEHFGNLEKLKPDDTVYFTDVNGVVTEYAVVLTELLSSTAIEDMTAGE